MGKLLTSLKHAVAAALPGLGLLAVAAAYFLFWTRHIENYDRERKERALVVMSDQIGNKLNALARLAGAADSQDKIQKEQIPGLRRAHKEPKNGIRGHRWMYFEAGRERFRIDLKIVVDLYQDREAFDTTILADENGQVLFESSSDSSGISNLFGKKAGKQASTETADKEAGQHQPFRWLNDGIKVASSGREYDAFPRLVPLNAEGATFPFDRLIVCGLSKRKHVSASDAAEFISEHTLPLLFLASMVCLAVPLQRAWSGRGLRRLQFVSGAALLFTSLFGVALAACFLLAWDHKTRSEADIDQQLRGFAERIQDGFKEDITNEIGNLKIIQTNEPYVSNFKEDLDRVKHCRRPQPGRRRTVEGVLRAVEMKDNKTTATFFWLDGKGWVRLRWEVRQTVQSDQSSDDVKVTRMPNRADRPYWQAIQEKKPLPSINNKDRFAIESLRSRFSGELETVLAMSTERDGLALAGITFRPPSVTRRDLPAGYGYAVVDRLGKVLYHGIEARVLAENFIRESEETLPREAIAPGAKASPHDIRYEGRPHRAFIAPIGITDLPWSVIVYRDLTGPNLSRSIILLSVLMFLALALGSLTVLILVLYRVRSRVYPEPLWTAWSSKFLALPLAGAVLVVLAATVVPSTAAYRFLAGLDAATDAAPVNAGTIPNFWTSLRTAIRYGVECEKRHYDEGLNPIHAAADALNGARSSSSISASFSGAAIDANSSTPGWPFVVGFLLFGLLTASLRPLGARLLFLGRRWEIATKDVAYLGTGDLTCGQLIIGPPLAGKTALIAARKDICVVDLARTPCKNAVAQTLSVTAKKPAETIVLDHFEHGLDRPDCVAQKAKLLEELLNRGRCVVLISNVDPQAYLKDGGSGLPDASGGVEPQLEERMRLFGLLARFDKVWLRDGERPLRAATGESRYYAQWSASSRREKLALVDLAEDGLVDPNSAEIVRRLVARNLVTVDPYLKFRDEGFRCFVRAVESEDLVKTWERDEKKGNRNVGRSVVIVGALATAIVMLVISRDLATTLLTALPALIAGMRSLAEQVMPETKMARVSAGSQKAQA